MNLWEAVNTLLAACEAYDISMSLEYDTGRFVSGEHLFDENGKPIPQENIPPEHVEQGPKGWRIEVGGYAREGLTDLKTAITSGIYMFNDVVREREKK